MLIIELFTVISTNFGKNRQIGVYVSFKTRLEEKMKNSNYLSLIENFTMHDIIVYNKIANDFLVLM